MSGIGLAGRTFAFGWRLGAGLVITSVSTGRHPSASTARSWAQLELTGDALELPGGGLTIITYTAAVESRAQEQLAFRASWTRSPAQVDVGSRPKDRPATSKDPDQGVGRSFGVERPLDSQ